ITARHLLRQHPLLQDVAEDDKRAVEARLVQACSVKDLSELVLDGLDYKGKKQPRMTANGRWIWLGRLFEERAVRALHIDEVQHLNARSNGEQQGLCDTFKARLQHPRWPVPLVLTGLSSFAQTIGADHQLARRVTVFEIPPLAMVERDRNATRDALDHLLTLAGLEKGKGLKRIEFCHRLHVAGCRFLASVCEAICDGIGIALLHGSSELEVKHFADAFRKRWQVADVFNPFIAQDFHGIDVRTFKKVTEFVDREGVR
ncbi:MAG: TniB family NTP-binding protein, partial [Pseudomonadota bacterium]